MLSINGIDDGKRIIPKDPIPLEKGKQFKVIITFLEPLEEGEKKQLSQFCGIWEDTREVK